MVNSVKIKEINIELCIGSFSKIYSIDLEEAQKIYTDDVARYLINTFITDAKEVLGDVSKYNEDFESDLKYIDDIIHTNYALW